MRGGPGVGAGVSGGGPRGGMRGRVSSLDADAQRRLNAEAPRIPNLGRRIASLFVPYRTPLVVIIVLVLGSAGIAAVQPLLTKVAFDVGLFPVGAGGEIGAPNLGALWQIVFAILVLLVVGQGLAIWQTWLTARVGNRLMGDLRDRMFEKLQSMQLGFFTATKTGQIQSRLQNDVGGVAGVLSNTVSSIVGNTATVLAALVSMLLLSWQLTIVAVIVMPVLVLVQRRVGQVRARIQGRVQESLAGMTAITQESLSVSGIMLAKSFGRQRAEIDRYAAENANQIGLQIKLAMSGQAFFAVVSMLLGLVPAVVYVVAGYLVQGGVPLSAGTIVAFTTVQARILWPMVGLMRVALDLQTSAALFARIFEYLDLTPTITDAPNARALPASAPASVRFESVEFSYPGAPEPTLRDIDFDVEPGQFVAFVGPSGAGKTTIASLIPRLWDVTGGAVLVGGADVRSITLESLVARLGIVSQETYLFHASIADNLRYANPDASDAQLELAARAADIHETIEGFPERYDTIVGERGYRLSGGEKQRVAIARVLLKDPDILILDEATSALDSVSERTVQRALDSAARGRTTIAIAHRLSTIEHADRIHVVVGGRIVESGTHAELLALGGEYTRLHDTQRSPQPSR